MGRSVQKECGIAPFIILPLCLGLGNTSITCVSSASQKMPNQLFKQGSPISQVEPLDHFGPSVAVYNSTSALRSERGTVADTVREKKIRTVVVRRKANISFLLFFTIGSSSCLSDVFQTRIGAIFGVIRALWRSIPFPRSTFVQRLDAYRGNAYIL